MPHANIKTLATAAASRLQRFTPLHNTTLKVDRCVHQNCINQNCKHLSAEQPKTLHDANAHLSSIRLLHVNECIMGRTFHKVVTTHYIVAFHICAEARASSKYPSGLCCCHWICSSAP